MNRTGRSGRSGRSGDRTAVVALAAALWGLDGLLRLPLATALHPATVVLWEHLVVVLLVSPWLPAAIRAFRACTATQRLAVAVIGIGASAVGTALFTAAFRVSAQTGDFVTPLILQKLQPVFAVLLAVLLLGERLRPRFALFALPALAGAWLLSFPDPFAVTAGAAKVALLALGAAALWGGGTVLGRYLSDSPATPRDLMALRFTWGLPAALVIVLVQGAPLDPGAANLPGLALLAIVPGLLALSLYYWGLRRTPASRATFAELAFPATAAVVGILVQDAHLDLSQWAGLALVAAAVTALSWHERVRVPAVSAGRVAPADGAERRRPVGAGPS